MKIVIVGGGPSVGLLQAPASTVEADVTIIFTDSVETIGVENSPTIQHIAKLVLMKSSG